MRSKRNAFTLVELLVVISIIGMLMAILLPAIGAATESARAAQCKNQMKQIALAMLGYESRSSSFPGYADGREDKENNSNPVPYSWVVSILPDLERQDIFDQYPRLVSQRNPEFPYLDFMVCPSDPPPNKNEPWTSFVANAGYEKTDASGCGIVNSAWPLTYIDSRRRKKPVVHQKTTIDKVSAADGTSTTMLLSENIQATTWADISFYEEEPRLDATPRPKRGTPPHNVFVFTDSEKPRQASYFINSEQSPTARITVRNARPSSEHRSGVNAAFVDGHVEFLRDNIDYTVYARLMSSDGKKCGLNLGSASHWQNVLLSDTDYK